MPSHIYTRTGDEGDTGLFGGERVPKDDLRVEAYGTIDELNAALGVVRTQITDVDVYDLLAQIQDTLFYLGADLAAPEDTANRGRVSIRRVRPEQVDQLETAIDRFEAELPPLTRFILPGGDGVAAAFHLARAVCRRAERRCVTLFRAEQEAGRKTPNPEVLRYLNRLADLLFVLARLANIRRGIPELTWNS